MGLGLVTVMTSLSIVVVLIANDHRLNDILL